ncbi:tol-pal system-associated acyl-CoA thioesterase [Rhodobaculum claviforme]|uniref:Tol-pal system-associated acyl-CoA thioesterase n=1 Tax=Rhodobaculum claviforme TaxID=1549854 RepID=A0A934WK19_9RHOB|nr:tol-pal system-associated acyl-CoA thioesterase [Rhodobaculum claviforme]
MHSHTVRVYYEDTDLAGIVYYANYLKFIERARSEWVRTLGLDQRGMRAQTGVVFAVRRVVADYLAPARFDDLLEVVSRPMAVTPARLVMDQRVLRDGRTLFTAQVTLVALDASGRAVRLPAGLRDAVQAAGPDHATPGQASDPAPDPAPETRAGRSAQQR